MKKLLGIMISTFLLFSLFTFITPSKVEAGCTCSPVSNVDYKLGKWVSDGEPCYKGDECVRSCGVTDSVCINNCSKCNPLTEASINPGFQVPTFSQLIGNVIRLIFFVAGLFALVFLLLGGFEWVQSGGEEKKIEAARGKITASVIGLVVMIAVLSLVIFLEQVVFGGKICLGISCPMNIGFLQLIR